MPRPGSGRELTCKHCHRIYRTSRTRRSTVFCSNACNRDYKKTDTYREEQRAKTAEYWSSLSVIDRQARISASIEKMTPEWYANRDRNFYRTPEWRSNQHRGAVEAARKRSVEDRSRAGKLGWQRHPEPRAAKTTHEAKNGHVITVDSSWEAILYDRLVDWGVGFSYVNEDKYHFRIGNRTWHPDFVFSDRRLIIEVKGFYAAVDRFNADTLPEIVNSNLLRRYTVAMCDRAAVKALERSQSFIEWLPSLAWLPANRRTQYTKSVQRLWG